MQTELLYRDQKPDIAKIMRCVGDAVLTLGTPCTACAVARHLGAVNKHGNALPSIKVALDLLELQEQEAVTPAVLEKLTAGLTVHALCELVKTLKAAQREREEIAREQL
jgi:hypothetical protein